METCENCGVEMGALETPCVINEHIVCAPCHARLSVNRTTPAVDPPREPVVAQYAAPVAAVWQGPNSIICPNVNCGFVGEGKVTSRGSTAIMILLLLLWILPGILYAIFYNGSIVSCPMCGVKVRDV